MKGNLPDHVDGLVKYVSQQNEKANEDLILKYFRKTFGEKFTRQSDAKGSDGYVHGHFVLELKGKSKDWLCGLFQGVAYQKELDFSLVVVAAKEFLAIWRVEDIDESIREEILLSTGAPNTLGKRFSNRYKSRQTEFLKKAIWSLRAEHLHGLFKNAMHIRKEVDSFKTALTKQKRVRRKVTTSNFTSTLKEMVQFFDEDRPMKAVRAFYSMVFGWTENSLLEISEKNKTQATLRGEVVDHLLPGKRVKFKNFVENHCVSLRNGENIDDFFAQYDKALDAVDSDFRRQHGIYFTNLELSKFVMWFVRQHEPELGDVGKNYLVIDPACGSGNLVTNWRSPLELRHKVVSEIEPELLYAVEQRMKGDAWHHGRYTVVPKVEEGRGLNFLDKDAEEYISVLRSYLEEKGYEPDKPIAFLCNPPYRSDDDQRAGSARYAIHPSVLELTGRDASAERYCCFLAQMKLICGTARESGLPGNSLLLLFTKAAWMTKRPVFERIRREMTGDFEDVGGFIVNGKEFFDVSGTFPIAFTIWKYAGDDAGLDATRPIPLRDLTWLKRSDLVSVNWQDTAESQKRGEGILTDPKSITVPFGLERPNIKVASGLVRFDFQREKRKAEKLDKNFRCGLPECDRRHARKKTLGEANGEFVGFMDDLTPCRIKKDSGGVPWFRLNNQFMDVRKTRCFSGPPDKYAYSAGDKDRTRTVFRWFALGRTFASHGYPMWVDADELWPITVPKQLERRVTRMCYAIGFAENECLEVTFPANNPIEGAKALRIANPMTPSDEDSFWSQHMEVYFGNKDKSEEARLVASVRRLFSIWEEEFKRSKELYVDYDRPYFVEEKILSKYAGLVQIRDYAKETNHAGLLAAQKEVQVSLKNVKDEFNAMLHDKSALNYFGIPATDQREPASSILSTSVIENRAALSSYIVNELHQERSFGRTKLAKLFYLLDAVIEEDLGTKYYREAAGPLDPYALYGKKTGIEKVAGELGYYHTQVAKSKKTREKVSYVPGDKISKGVAHAVGAYRKHLPRIVNIINQLRPLNTERCEIVATLYACWNDMLIEGRNVTDDAIVDEFLNRWHRKKRRFARSRLVRALTWMREKDIAPTGSAPMTVPRERLNQDELFE